MEQFPIGSKVLGMPLIHKYDIFIEIKVNGALLTRLTTL